MRHNFEGNVGVVYVCVCGCVRVCMYVYVCVCSCTRAACMKRCVCIYMYVCVCVCMCMCVDGYEGGIVTDPAVLFDHVTSLFYMYHTCVDYKSPDHQVHLLICGATSKDGTVWHMMDTLGGASGTVKGVCVYVCVCVCVCVCLTYDV